MSMFIYIDQLNKQNIFSIKSTCLKRGCKTFIDKKKKHGFLVSRNNLEDNHKWHLQNNRS